MRKAYLFCLALSNHIHNINVFHRPQGEIQDIFGEINLKGKKEKKNLTLDCKQGKVHNCVAWYLLVDMQCCRGKVLPEQDKGHPQRARGGREKAAGGRRVRGQRGRGLTPVGQ